MTDNISYGVTDTSVFNAAVHMAQAGWMIFPAPPGEKKSYKSIEFSGTLWGATRDPDIVRDDFTRWPQARIGLLTGPDNNCFVLDVDTEEGHGVDGFASLALLETAHGSLPPTLQAESPSGSIHYYFRHPGIHVRSRKLKGSAGIDVKGNGGMIIAPPSANPEGGAYRWRNALPIADAPSWLLDMIVSTEPDRATATDVAAITEYSIDEIRWWIDRNRSEFDEITQDQGEWVFFGKALKLHAPGDDGLDLLLSLTYDGAELITKRWWNEFSADYKAGMRTWAHYVSTDNVTKIDWMFRHVIGCPRPARDGQNIEIAPEILKRHRAERDQYLAAQIGPLPEHPELTAPQADALVQFWAHLPSGKIIHEASRALWASGSFDKHVGRVKDAMKLEGPGALASTWLSQHRAVQSIGWEPAEPMIIEGRVLTEGGWMYAPGCRTFNLYAPSNLIPAKGDVSLWLDHLRFIYPAEAEHVIAWFAHRVQRPGDKINHGLVFIGSPGIGKDTAIEPVVAAIGSHNFKSITAAKFFNSDFNGYLKSVMLRIDEVHDLGGESKYAFHDRTKPILAAPPMMHDINEKHVPHHAARNVCGVILTSNHADALFLDREDRRHFVCISDRRKDEFPNGYFERLYRWFDAGGNEAVAYYLAHYDLTAFDAKAPPPKTAGWHAVVAAGLAPESGDLTDAIADLGTPPAVTIAMIKAKAPMRLLAMFEDAKFRKNIPRRFSECGYVAVVNPDAVESGGRWRLPGGKAAIYARQDLSEPERVSAARRLVATGNLSPSTPRGQLPPLPY
ncbi:MAG: bifunctional DNA primase/polymerase [Xanthobacteraceae bacterium]|nr:bifunctional DNA primase/polymerase [Xanthobacteraceae bacterium]